MQQQHVRDRQGAINMTLLVEAIYEADKLVARVANHTTLDGETKLALLDAALDEQAKAERALGRAIAEAAQR